MTVDAETLVKIKALQAIRARTVKRSWAPQEPLPKQREFLDLDCLEAFYGGAAGGGKSSSLLIGALQYVDVPGYAALILRRTYADLALPGAIMDRASTWLAGTPARWNGQDKRWTFPSGATVTFGYLDTEKDKFRYASAEFQYIAFDELTQFPEGWYRFLMSRLRRVAGMDVPLRVRAAGNPGGIGHEWVRQRFVAASGSARRFIPATLDDNPHLDRDAYRASLAELDETTRRQLEYGEWIQNTGGLVYPANDANIIDELPVAA